MSKKLITAYCSDNIVQVIEALQAFAAENPNLRVGYDYADRFLVRLDLDEYEEDDGTKVSYLNCVFEQDPEPEDDEDDEDDSTYEERHKDAY